MNLKRIDTATANPMNLKRIDTATATVGTVGHFWWSCLAGCPFVVTVYTYTAQLMIVALIVAGTVGIVPIQTLPLICPTGLPMASLLQRVVFVLVYTRGVSVPTHSWRFRPDLCTLLQRRWWIHVTTRNCEQSRSRPRRIRRQLQKGGRLLLLLLLLLVLVDCPTQWRTRLRVGPGSWRKHHESQRMEAFRMMAPPRQQTRKSVNCCSKLGMHVVRCWA
jgi:hypothetical protein